MARIEPEWLQGNSDAAGDMSKLPVQRVVFDYMTGEIQANCSFAGDWSFEESLRECLRAMRAEIGRAGLPKENATMEMVARISWCVDRKIEHNAAEYAKPY